MKLDEKELKELQDIQEAFGKLKASLGDIELHKHETLKRIDRLKAVLQNNEQKLIEKYGKDSVVNIETGIITKEKK